MIISPDIIYLGVGLALGFTLGYNHKAPLIEKKEEKLPKDVEQLQEQLLVYKNLRESLLADVRYWRDKATKNVIQK
jgi:hypothetical protein